MKTPNGEETIFAAALALLPEERAACLDQACGGDAALRHRVEVLLNAGIWLLRARLSDGSQHSVWIQIK